MLHVTAAFLFFLLFCLTHMATFRLRMVQFQTPVIIVLSLFWYLGLTAVFVIFPESESKHPGTAPLPVSASLIYFLLCLWYLAQCTAVQNESPSMKIMGYMISRPQKKATLQELEKLFTNEEFLCPRVEDLVTHGFLRFDGESYHLQLRARPVIGFVRAYRRLLKRGLGG